MFVARHSFEKVGFEIPWARIKNWATIAAPGAILGSLGLVGEAFRDHSEQKQHGASLAKMKAMLVRPDLYGDKLDVADAKFDELASLAPRAMQNPTIAVPLLESAIRYGAHKPEDIARITQIESNLGTARPPKKNLLKGFIEGAIGGTSMVKNVLDSESAAADTDLKRQQLVNEVGKRPAPKDQFAMNAEALYTRALGRALGKGRPSNEEESIAQINELRQQVNEGLLEKNPEVLDAVITGLMNVPTLKKEGSVSPEAAGRILATSYCMSKTAGLSSKTKEMLTHGLLLAGASILSGLGFAAINKGIEAGGQASTKKRLEGAFDQAITRLKTSPDDYSQRAYEKLKDDPKHYGQLARDAFDALATAAPAMAANPLVAKDFIQTTLELDGTFPHDKLKVFSDSQRTVNQNSQLPIGGAGASGFRTGFELTGGPQAVKSTVGNLVTRQKED